MFPLDAIDSWPRLYGPSGLIQYQFAVPTGQEEVVARVIERVRHVAGAVLLGGAQALRPGQREPPLIPP